MKSDFTEFLILLCLWGGLIFTAVSSYIVGMYIIEKTNLGYVAGFIIAGIVALLMAYGLVAFYNKHD